MVGLCNNDVPGRIGDDNGIRHDADCRMSEKRTIEVNERYMTDSKWGTKLILSDKMMIQHDAHDDTRNFFNLP